MQTFEIPVSIEVRNPVTPNISSALPPLEQRIVAALYQVAVGAFSTNAASCRFWTDGIKDALSSLAEDEQLLCCHSRSIGEWLYDICWVETSENADTASAWRGARRLRLVCECEWAEDENNILWDFMKLAWANADLRVFIYTNHMKRGQQTHPVDLCCGNCPPADGARYLFIGFPKHVSDGEQFRVDSWVQIAKQ